MRFEPKTKLVIHKQFHDYLQGNNFYPINVEISISGICNAKCSWCFYKNDHSKKLINKEVLLKTINDLECKDVKAITWTGGGEPTCHPYFDVFINNTNIKQGLFTNALGTIKYNPNKLEWIRVSKTERDWNVENLKKLRECKTLGMCINYIGNDNEIYDALKIAEELKINYVQVRPALNVGNNPTIIKLPNIQHPLLFLTNYKFEESSKTKNYTKCFGYHFVPFIWENGDVDVCAYQCGKKNYNLGNIYNESIIDILNRRPKNVLVDSNCQICCKNHEINKFINDLDNIEDKDFV